VILRKGYFPEVLGIQGHPLRVQNFWSLIRVSYKRTANKNNIPTFSISADITEA
jgi:hypothetical protein